MQNPWALDKDEVPDDAGIGQTAGRMKIVGADLFDSVSHRGPVADFFTHETGLG